MSASYVCQHLCHFLHVLISMERSNNLNFTIQLILIMKFASLFLVLLDIYNFFDEVLNSFASVTSCICPVIKHVTIWSCVGVAGLLYSKHTRTCRILNIIQNTLTALTQYLMLVLILSFDRGGQGIALITGHVALLLCSLYFIDIVCPHVHISMYSCDNWEDPS